MSRPRHARRRRTPWPAVAALLATAALLASLAALLPGRASALRVLPVAARAVLTPDQQTADDTVSTTSPTGPSTDAPPPAPEDPERGAPPPPDTGGPTQDEVAAVAPSTDGEAAAPSAIEIPGIGVRSDLVELDLDEHRRLEVPADASVAGWYVRAPRPGEPGPAIIAGHVDSRRGPGVFWRLHELQPGDEIDIHRADGTLVRFVVDRVERWAKDEFPTDAVYRQSEGAELRLITCGGDFDRSSGSYRDNVIAFASLASRL